MSNALTGLTSPLIGSVALEAMIGRGKEGATYRITGKPNLVAKIYHSPPSPKTIKKLEIMISNPPILLGKGRQRPSLAWPQAFVHDRNRSVCGFMMPVVEPTWPINSLFFPERRAKLRTAANDPIGWHHLHEIARNLSLTVSACHQSGYIVGDLNNNNVRIYSDGQVCLIDTDSFQVVDNSRNPPVFHHSEVVFLDYAAPELLGQDLTTFDRTPACDCYALATLIFMLLQDGLHPFAAVTSTDPPLDPSRLMQTGRFPYSTTRRGPSVTPYPMAPTFGRLHPRLRELFIRTFTIGLADPPRRPSAELWQQALGSARADLRKCARGHYFVGQPNARCLQVVPVIGGGYCGSSEQSRSVTPIPFGDIDVISGKAISAGTTVSGSAPSIDLSAPQSPPPPTPPPPPTLQQNSGSGGGKIRTYAVSTIVVLLLVLAIARQFNGDSPSEPTVVASSFRSPTALPKKPTPAPSRAPSIIPSQRPEPAATKAPSPTPKTLPNEKTNQSRPSDGSNPTVSLPQPGIEALLEVLSQVRKSDSIFFSSQTAIGWNLTIAVPDYGTEFSLKESVQIDPAPALSHRKDRLAYLERDQSVYLVHLLDLRTGSTISLSFPPEYGFPINLAWQASDNALLVTSTQADEPRIYSLDVNSGDIEEFLPPWSANPSVSRTGEMVYVVPFGNDPDNLGIVSASNDGSATGRPFVLYATSNEDFPSLDSSDKLVAYTISEGDDGVYTLGISRRYDNDSFIRISLQNSFSSSTRIRTAWVDSNRIAVGTCNDGACEILLYSLLGSAPTPLLNIPETTALGNIIFRSA